MSGVLGVYGRRFRCDKSNFCPTAPELMALNTGDDKLASNRCNLSGQLIIMSTQIFESSEAVKVISTFDDLGLKEDLLRGIYAYS